MTTPGVELTGQVLHPGRASALSLKLDPLSFWGGTDLRTGVITDGRHPQHGVSLAGRSIVMRSGRGSSSSSSVLAEQLRAGVGPAGIVLAEPDAIILVGALVAAELYGQLMPVIQLTVVELDLIPDGKTLLVDAEGTQGRVVW
ncbi:MAG: aconitase X swivel domain-containing protein [Pseudonocardiaceae bacterium]